MSSINNSTAKSDDLKNFPGANPALIPAGSAEEASRAFHGKTTLKKIGHMSGAAADILVEGLESAKKAFNDININNPIDRIIEGVFLPKNIPKATRKDVRAKNNIKVMCKSKSYGSYTTCNGVHLTNFPLKLNMVCVDCKINFASGREESGSGRGKVLNSGLN